MEQVVDMFLLFNFCLVCFSVSYFKVIPDIRKFYSFSIEDTSKLWLLRNFPK